MLFTFVSFVNDQNYIGSTHSSKDKHPLVLTHVFLRDYDSAKKLVL